VIASLSTVLEPDQTSEALAPVGKAAEAGRSTRGELARPFADRLR
jgi:hypothetical protein